MQVGKINNVSMLITNSTRSMAYLQNLIDSGVQIDDVVYLKNCKKQVPSSYVFDGSTSRYSIGRIFRSNDLDICVDTRCDIDIFLKEKSILTYLHETLDANSDEVINSVKKLKNEIVIFSGPAGCILRKEILSLNKSFIHVHPGVLPSYRGSTTYYYSLIQDGRVGASVIKMDNGIDTGRVFLSKSFALSEFIDFDSALDPLLRARLLIDFIKGERSDFQQSENEARTFYVIHPVLKHIAIEKQRKVL